MYTEGYKVEHDEDGDELQDSEKYTLSANQAKFCNDAEDEGLEIDFMYSGRGMYGRYCPAVRLDRGERFGTKAKVSEDGMGLGSVVYASR